MRVCDGDEDDCLSMGAGTLKVFASSHQKHCLPLIRDRPSAKGVPMRGEVGSAGSNMG